MSDRTSEQRAADRREIEKLHPGERFQMMLEASDAPETDALLNDALSWADSDGSYNELRRKLESAGRWGSAGDNALEIVAAAYRRAMAERDELRARVAELEGALKETTKGRDAALQRLLEKVK